MRRRIGVLGADGSILKFIATVAIFPSCRKMGRVGRRIRGEDGNVPFPVKEVFPLAASPYLLKEDVASVTER